MPLYLVEMNLTRTNPLLPVDQLTELIKGAILPSVESLTKLQAQGKVVTGGYPIGRPAIVLLVDTRLPIWEQTEAEITPLQDFRELRSPDDPA
jgi:hypothetical protein